jgi:hypothetical protein
MKGRDVMSEWNGWCAVKFSRCLVGRTNGRGQRSSLRLGGIFQFSKDFVNLSFTIVIGIFPTSSDS